MSEPLPTGPEQVQAFYKKIAPLIESPTGVEPQIMIRGWNERLFRDMRSEAEVLMLMHGQSVSDRYLYGFCSAIAAVREENGGLLPELDDAQYQLDREIQDSHLLAQDSIAGAYFADLAERFGNKFPLTVTLLGALERDLRTRLKAPEIDIEEGFSRGYYKAVKVVSPLLSEVTD